MLTNRLRRHVPWRYAAVALLLASPVSASELERLLNDLQWEARVLLIFTAGENDARAAQFLKAIDDNACEVAEREIRVGRFDPGNEGYIAEEEPSGSASMLARERFGIGPEEFRIFLIGKDGGVKATYQRVPKLRIVLDLIDGMPMRRREAHVKASSCR